MAIGGWNRKWLYVAVILCFCTHHCGSICAPGYIGPNCYPCTGGRWGENCANQCHCTVQCEVSDGRCYRLGGTCKDNYAGSTCQQCASTYWGTSCTSRCYCSGGCDQSTGSCGNNPCHTGYTGSRCTDCADYYKRGSGSTCVPCDANQWGENCQYTCSRCNGGCYNNIGACVSGCIDGYTGNSCQSCATGYRSSGSSCVPCSSGTYSNSCASQCHCSVTCDHVTGECPGSCDAGYEGSPCRSCSSGRYGVDCANDCHCSGTCNSVTGHCTGGCDTGYTGIPCRECTTGKYGDNCASNCHCSTTCDHVTGECPGDCDAGYSGDPCTPCAPGRYGVNCAYRCHCAGTCNNRTGRCTGDCDTGYTRVNYVSPCRQCTAGTWGDNCSRNCHCSVPCHHVTGQCTGYCTGHYDGETCQECDRGYWETTCNNVCRCNNGCRQADGYCYGRPCHTGYTGSDCQSCATGYRRSVSACVPCSAGYYGNNCANECHCSVTCHHVSGNCPGPCDAGYSGDPCSPCSSSRWGVDCAYRCNCGSGCNRVEGGCGGGSCWTGYTGATCQQCDIGYRSSGQNCVLCNNGWWGNDCDNQCYCSQPCNQVNGVCGDLCVAGRYGLKCQHLCTDGTWGAGNHDQCPYTCNCADPDEICEPVDGHCNSGCADWYTGTGCDYEMLHLSVGEIPRIQHINGKNVTVLFTQWRREFGGTGTVSHYEIEYSALDSDEYVTLSPYRFVHASSASTETVTIIMPDIRTNYTIRIVPYESSDIYSGPGEPSPGVPVFTQCADGWYGLINCTQQCNCADDSDICNKINGACEGCHVGFLGFDCQIKAPTLQEQSVDIKWQDKDILVTFDKISDTNDYSINYELEFQLKSESNWQTVMINTNRRKRSTVPRQLLQTNSEYECRIVPVFYDRQRNQYTRGQTSAVHEVVTGCETPSDVSQFYPSACEHWCECGEDEYCLLTSGYCNGLCDAQCTRLPNADNTDVMITADSESIKVHITNNGTRIEYYTLVYSRVGHNDSLQYNHTSIDGSILTGLSPNTAYTINVYPFTSRSSKVYVSPPITKEISTFPPEDGSPIVVIVCIVLVLLLIIAVVVCLLVYFLIIRKRRRNKNKYSDNEKDYYNLTSTNVPITTVNGSEYAEAKPTKTASTDLYANDAAITKAAADASKKPKLAVKPATKSKPMVVASGTCSVDEFINKRSKIPDAQLEDEYKAIPENKEAISERGDLKVNYEKHRFNNIKAYDHSRVVLDKLEDDPYSDYVNAAFITGYGGTEKAFVASQGPRKPTIGDMWRLIWKINTNLIVMLTNLLENKKIKCQQYWPDDRARFYHGIEVETLETKNYAFYTRRLFLVKKEDETRQITHMQFTQWPDHGVPETPNELMEFFFIVQSMEPSLKGPLMVHCSAGVGRTGTFIALDYLLKQAAAEDAVDVCACVKELRKNRCQMVQTASQYVFLHKALRQTLISKPSSIKMEAFIPSIVESDDYTTKLVDQYNRLNKIRPKALDATTAKSRENIEKNNDPSVLADDKHRVKLTTAVDGCTDYIQAVKCGTYTQTDALVLTQIPLKHTIADIWRLCHETTVCSIITLEGEVAVPYWPQELEKSDLYGPLEVTFNSESSTNYQGVTVRNFTLKKDSKKNCTKIKQWHVHTAGERGEEGGEETIHAWLHVYEQARNWKLSDSSASSTVLIQCRDGAQRSGAFAAMWSILEKLEAESVVDVDFAIRRVRQCRPQAVVSDQQYQMLYDIVKVYLEDRQTGYYNA